MIILVLAFTSLRVLEWQRAAANIEVDKRIQAENEAYRTLAQIAGGAFFLLTAYFTWRTVRVSEEGQVTERFTKAIEQLGDDENLAKRLGGIYALERISRDS